MMNMSMRTLVAGAALAGALIAPGALSAQAEWSANAGWVSQYYYRGLGIKQSSASAGLDVAAGSFSAGTWAADVGDGSEVDLYAGVGIPLGESASLSLGGTGYFYTGEADQTYLEGNLGLGFGIVSVEYAGGVYKTDPDQKYSFFAVTVEQNGLYATVGTSAYAADFGDTIGDAFDPDLGLQYLEAGYGFTAGEMDFSVSGIWNDSALSGEIDGGGDPTHELTLVFGVSKTFALN